MPLPTQPDDTLHLLSLQENVETSFGKRAAICARHFRSRKVSFGPSTVAVSTGGSSGIPPSTNRRVHRCRGLAHQGVFPLQDLISSFVFGITARFSVLVLASLALGCVPAPTPLLAPTMPPSPSPRNVRVLCDGKVFDGAVVPSPTTSLSAARRRSVAPANDPETSK